MQKSRLWAFALLLTLLLALGVRQKYRLAGETPPPRPAAQCSFFFEKEKLCADLVWTRPPVNVAAPTEKNQAEFTLRFWKEGLEPGEKVAADPASGLLVSLWMPAMGHGSEPTEVRKDARMPGVFQVGHVLFSMGGDWEIWVTLLDGNRFIEKARMSYRLE